MKKRKKNKNTWGSDLQRSRKHLNEMEAHGDRLKIDAVDLHGLIPDFSEVKDKLDISLAESEFGATWDAFDRRDAHAWMGKAYGEVKLLEMCAQRAIKIANQLIVAFFQAQSAVELAESALVKIGATSRSEAK